MMSAAKQRLDECISHFLTKNVEDRDIARRLFLHDTPEAFKQNPNSGFELFNEISIKWNVPFSQIKASGSAQLGYSYYKRKDYKEGSSDLDVAIISPALFHTCSELCYTLTRRYTDRTGFTGVYDLKPYEQVVGFLDYLAKGYFRPDYMPNCQLKTTWNNFFGSLSQKYYSVFKFRTITAGVYLTEVFFEYKQANLVDEYRKESR